MVSQNLHQAALPNPSFTAQQHDLPLTILDLLPAFEQQRHFGFAPHKRGQASGRGDIETTLGITFLYDAIHLLGIVHAFQGMLSQLLADEIALYK